MRTEVNKKMTGDKAVISKMNKQFNSSEKQQLCNIQIDTPIQ